MSKRRNREKQPNLPKATLDRAREQAGLPVDRTAEPEQPAQTQKPTSAAKPVAASGDTRGEKPKSPSAAARRRKITAAQLERSQKRGENTYEMVQYLLANPTKDVTESQLREEYGYVLRDLRNMGLLAAVLVIALIGIAQII